MLNLLYSRTRKLNFHIFASICNAVRTVLLVAYQRFMNDETFVMNMEHGRGKLKVSVNVESFISAVNSRLTMELIVL